MGQVLKNKILFLFSLLVLAPLPTPEGQAPQVGRWTRLTFRVLCSQGPVDNINITNPIPGKYTFRWPTPFPTYSIEQPILGKPSLILLEKTSPAPLMPLFLHPECLPSTRALNGFFTMMVCSFLCHPQYIVAFSKKKDHALHLFMPCDYHKAFPTVDT